MSSHHPYIERIQFVVALIFAGFSLIGCGAGPAPTASPRTEQPANVESTARSSDRYDLERDESRGGHTLARHVARTDEQLAERLQRERHISAASTWTNRATAEASIAEALRAESGRVESWMSRGYPRANLALHFDAGRNVGRSLRRGNSAAVPCTEAVIVLRADGPHSFYVLTAYPEARE